MLGWLQLAPAVGFPVTAPAGMLDRVFGAGREAGLNGRTVLSMLPALAVIAMQRAAAGAKNGLDAVLAAMPSLGRCGRGSPHADLADILRRGCGAGPYGPGRLRRVVRSTIARAAGFPPRGALRWYLQFMLVRPASRPSSGGTSGR